jgi:hypothetical protein
MEGRVFICSWKRVGSRYRVWWKARPKVAAEGDTFEEADEALWDAIMEATGDGENMHEYEPPAPGSAAKRGPDVVMVGGGEWGELRTLEGLFENGVCTDCEHARGPRNESRLVITRMNSGPRHCGSVRVTLDGARMRYVSETFRAMLTPEEDASVQWREIVGPPRTRKQLFEVLGAATTIPYVAPLGPTIFRWRCEACGHVLSPFHGKAPGNGPYWFIAAAALPSPPTSLLVFGNPPDLDIGFTRERWRSLMDEPGAKGCKSSSIGVLRENQIDTSPVKTTWRQVWGSRKKG